VIVLNPGFSSNLPTLDFGSPARKANGPEPPSGQAIGNVFAQVIRVCRLSPSRINRRYQLRQVGLTQA
jgi:hypothetical protein